MSKRKNQPGVDVTIVGDRNATAAGVTVRTRWLNDRLLEVQAAGTAKREPGDRYEPETGAALALARAMHNAADTLELTARTRVVQVEQQAAAERARREMQRMLKALPKPKGPGTGEIRKLYGEDAAQLHKARQHARRAREVYDGA